MTKVFTKHLKIITLFIGLSAILINCQNDEISIEDERELNLKTVSIKQAKQIFESFKNSKSHNYLHRTDENDELVVSPNWETIEQNELDYTDALMT